MTEWFLDMCIPIYYASGEQDKLVEKAKIFVKNKREDEFVVCCYILDYNLPRWIKRQEILLDELKIKIKEPSYKIGSSYQARILTRKDIIRGDKFFFSYSDAENKEEFLNILKAKQAIIELGLSYFIKNLVDKRVVPISEIDFELKSSLFTYFDSNDSDAKTLASAVQQHNKENLIILTGDKEHWTKQLLGDAVEIHPALRKKYPKVPEIRYLQNL